MSKNKEYLQALNSAIDQILDTGDTGFLFNEDLQYRSKIIEDLCTRQALLRVIDGFIIDNESVLHTIKAEIAAELDEIDKAEADRDLRNEEARSNIRHNKWALRLSVIALIVSVISLLLSIR